MSDIDQNEIFRKLMHNKEQTNNSETDDSYEKDVTVESTDDEYEQLLKRFEEDYHEKKAPERTKVPEQKNVSERKNVSENKKDSETPKNPELQKTDSAEVPGQAKTHSTKSRSIIIVFVFILLGMLISELVFPDKIYSEKENRTLTAKPEINMSSVLSGEYMKRLEEYLSDQIPGRDMIVSARTFFMRTLGKKEINDVIVGKDGWLFKKQTEFSDSVTETTDKLKEFAAFCGIENQVFMLVPNSTYVVNSKLPAGYVTADQKEIIDKIYSDMPEYIVCFDTCSVLNDYNNKEELYYKTDHHWTTVAAKAVFDNFAELWGLDRTNIVYRNDVLTNNFYGTLASSSGLKIQPDSICAVVPENCSGTYIMQNVSSGLRKPSLFEMDKLNSTNKYEVFFGGNFSRINIDTVNSEGNKLLILKDSYANCFIPMLTPYFSEIVIIDARYSTEKIKNVIESEKFTHLLVLYNLNTFLEDVSLKDIL